MSTTTIREILEGRQLLRIAPSGTVEEAARLMADHGVGAVAVVDEGNLVGILTERDVVFRVVARGLAAAETTVNAIMTPGPVSVDIDDAISDALAVKLGDRFRHLPVMDGSAVVGLLSYRDIPPEYVMMFEHFREMSSSRADTGA